MATSDTIQTNKMPQQIECWCSLEIYIIHLGYCGNFQQIYKNLVIFGQQVSLNDQSMLHGILIKIDILFAQIMPAERPLTVSGPFTGIGTRGRIDPQCGGLFILSLGVQIFPILFVQSNKEAQSKLQRYITLSQLNWLGIY